MSFASRVRENFPTYADRILAIVRLSQDCVRAFSEYEAIHPAIRSSGAFNDLPYSARPRDIALAAIDAVLGTHGVEGFAADFRGDNAVSYANTGDSYIVTVCLVTADGLTSWRVSSVGEVIEWFERRGVTFG